MSETPRLLPLGSAVKIEDDDNSYVIIARGFQKSNEGFLAGYKGVPHPHGAAASVKAVVIKQTQIIEVVHQGYENQDDAAFARQQLENAKSPPAAKEPAAEPDLTVDLSKPAKRTPAEPQPAPHDGGPGGAVSNQKDPFGELRSKGKRK